MNEWIAAHCCKRFLVSDSGYNNCFLFHFPAAEQSELERVEVEYVTCPGWQASTAHVTTFSDLPANAQAYVRKLEEFIGVSSEFCH